MSVGKEQKEQGSTLPMSSDYGTPVGAPQDTADVTTGPHRRPTTRSQSGVSTKRRRQERSTSPGGRDSASEAGGRHRTHKHHKSLDGGILTATTSSGSTSTAASSEHERSSVVSATSVDSESNDPSEYKTSQITFLDGSLTATATNRSDRPGPKSRANLPVPVPNLTKKSRGRRVPIKAAQNGEESSPAAKDGRTYVCSVEGCGKCFHRGEHLKRHIRSIHTHEKPFKCTHGLCTKTFNRHDNLLQHLKVHKGREISPSPSDLEDNDKPPYRPDSDEEDSPSSSPPSSPRVIPPPPQARLIPKKIAKEVISRSRDTSPGPDSNRRQRSLSPPPSHARTRPTVITAPTSFRTIYNAKSVAPPRYDPVAFGGPLAGPGGSANLAGSTTSIFASSTDRSRMAVSSLRTGVDREVPPPAVQESPLRRLCELAVSSSPVRGV